MSSVLPDTAIISAALDRLEPLEPDKYIIAFGSYSEQFIGTPNGYKATYIPPALLCELSSGQVKRIIWASFGCNPDSYFFKFELHDGTFTFRIGTSLPTALQSFVRDLGGSGILMAGLRIQLGANDSFVAWSKTAWICSKVPLQLDSKLQQGSSYSRTANTTTKGSLREGTLDDVQWHPNGSFYIKKGDRHLWNFSAHSVSSAWNEMWEGQRRDERIRSIVEELAHVTISPYSERGETFVFVKKKPLGKEPPFIVHFEGESRHSNFVQDLVATERSTPSVSALDGSLDCAAPSIYSVEFNNATYSNGRLQLTDVNLEGLSFRWAISKKAGRPHMNDKWDLQLNKGERLKILREMGREWYIAVNNRCIIGWVHGSWIDFCDGKVHRDPKALYASFKGDLQKLLIPGQLQDFPKMGGYVDDCTKPECKPQKQDTSSLGICIHDLQTLLEGSGSFSYEWLKEGRNLWHPDRFARFCKRGEADRLKPLAEQMFVMYGMLMENCQR